tara:strand:- start:156 stop:389 length:234 start_codon:yes stop_codon:yes gene_type:complete
MSSIIQNTDQSLQRNPDLEIRMDKALAIIIRETPLADAGCESAKQLVVNAHLEQEKIWDELEELEIDFQGDQVASWH